MVFIQLVLKLTGELCVLHSEKALELLLCSLLVEGMEYVPVIPLVQIWLNLHMVYCSL
jgi:hypothetical protein